MSRQPAIFALTVPSTTRQSHDLISPEKTMPRPTTSLRIAVCAASAALAADWLGVIGAVAGVPRGLKVLFIIGFPRVCASWPAIRHLTPFARARPGQIWYRLTVATRLPGARPICDAMAQMRPSYAATSRGGAAAGDA